MPMLHDRAARRRADDGKSTPVKKSTVVRNHHNNDSSLESDDRLQLQHRRAPRVAPPPHLRACMQIVSVLLGEPLSVNALRDRYGLSKAQAHRDLENLWHALGLVPAGGSSWVIPTRCSSMHGRR
jgi:hypothetical protein